jgi:hypothetical protein
METLFEKLLREKIEIMMEMRIQSICVTGATDFPDYKHNLGYLEALRNLLDALDEVRDEIGKR